MSILHRVFVLASVLLAAALPARAAFEISASSWIGGAGNTDHVAGTRILPDGRIVLAVNLDDSEPLAAVTRSVLNGGNGAVLILRADGRLIESATRVAAEVHDLAIDDAGNIYVAAGQAGALKLDPTATNVLWQRQSGSFVYRIDAGTDGTAAALVPGDTGAERDNKAQAGQIHVYANDAVGTPLTNFAGSGHTLDVCVDSRTGTVIYTGWYNLLVYNGPYSRSYNGLTVTPVDVPYTHGVPYNYGQSGVPRKWTLNGLQTSVWIDQANRIPNPRYVNYPFSTAPSNLYTQAEIDAMETAESRADGYYQYLLDMPKNITNNMADSRSYRCVIGRDGKLYIGSEADGGNTPLLWDGNDLTKKAAWSVSDGYFDVFYNTSTVPKIVVSRYELFSSSAEWRMNVGYTNRKDPNVAGGPTDNTVSIMGGGLAADEEGRVYITGESFFGLYLPGNTHPSFSIPRAGETAFDPFTNAYLGGSFAMVISPNGKQRLFTTRLGGGRSYAIDARTLPENEDANFVWGGQINSSPAADLNTLHTVNPVQANRAGSTSGADGFFAVVAGTRSDLKALAGPDVQATAGATVTLDASASFSDVGTLTSFVWRDINTGLVLATDERATLTLPVGVYALELTVKDSTGGVSRDRKTVTVKAANGTSSPAFETEPPSIAVATQAWSYAVSAIDADGTSPTLAASGLPAGVTFTSQGSGHGLLSGTPTTPGDYEITLTASDGTYTAVQRFTLRVFSGGLGGTLINDTFASDTTSEWGFLSHSSSATAPFSRWHAGGLQGYTGQGVLTSSGHHIADSTVQSALHFMEFPFAEDLTGSTLTTPGILRDKTAATARLAVRYDEAGVTKWAVSDQSVFTATGTGQNPVAGSWPMNTFTWKALDPANLNAGGGAAVAAATVRARATAVGVLGTTSGSWLRDRMVQIDGLALASVIDPTPNDAPVFDTLPATAATSGAAYSSQAVVSDPNGHALTLALEGAKPAWLTVGGSGNTFTLSGTPSGGDVGLSQITLRATDSQGQATRLRFQLRVTSPVAPVFVSAPATRVDPGSAYAYSVRAYDENGLGSLTLSAPAKPAWLTFTDLGGGRASLTGTAPSTAGDHNLVLRVTDGQFTVDQAYTLQVRLADNIAPFARVSATPASGPTSLNVFFSAGASADIDGSIASYAWHFGDGTTGTGMTTSKVYTNAGRYTATVTVTDNRGASSVAAIEVLAYTGTNLGPVMFDEVFATDTSAAWSVMGQDPGGGSITRAFYATGQSGFITTASAAPGVLVARYAHRAATSIQTAILWRAFSATDLRDGTVASTGIHLGTPGPLGSAFVIRYNDGGTTRWAISDQSAHTSTGTFNRPAVATTRSLSTLTWKELDLAVMNTAPRLAAVDAALVLGNATGFGVYGQASGTYLQTKGLQLDSLSLWDAPNAVPVFTSTPVRTATAGQAYSYAIAATDADAQAVTFSVVGTLPSWLTLGASSGNAATLSGTPGFGQVGDHLVTLRATDGTAHSYQSFTVTVLAPLENAAPVAVDDNASTNEGVSVLINVLANDSDPDGAPSPISIYGVSSANGGSVVVQGSSVNYTPAAGFHGTDAFTYTVTDGDKTDTATVTITVQSTALANNLTSANLTGANTGSATGSSRILADGAWELNGSGSGLGGTADAVRLEARSVTGGFDMLVRVASLAGTGSAPRAGLLVRSSAAPGSVGAWVSLAPNGSVQIGSRSVADGATTLLNPSGALVYPSAWIALSRVGDTVTFSSSEDGTSWGELASVTLPALGATTQAGLFVSSGDLSLARAVVDDFVIVPLVNATSFNDELATNGTLAQWQFSYQNTLTGVPTKEWLSSGKTSYNTSASAAPGVVRGKLHHVSTSSTQSVVLWRAFTEIDLRGGTVSTTGIHLARVGTAGSAYIVRFMDGTTERFAIADQTAHTTSGTTVVAAVAATVSLQNLTWKELNTATLNTPRGATALDPALVLSRATGFGVYGQSNGTWLADHGLQIDSLKLEYLVPGSF